MVIATSTYLVTIAELWRLDILIWVAGIPLLILAAMLLWQQVHHHKQLQSNLALLSNIKHHSVEYEMVLKAMHLCIWRIYVQTKTITLESDYRDVEGTLLLPPNAPIQALYDIIKPAYREHVQQCLDELMTGKREEGHVQYEIVIPNTGISHWEDVYATIEKRDVDGRPLVIVGTLMRFDEQKNIEQALIDARNHAEESDRLKTAFLANMSHEVRTPLNAIVGFSDVLTMAQDEEERTQLITLIKQNNAHLLRLFDDMMNMSKLEASGQDAAKNSRFKLTALLQEVVDKYMDPCIEKGLTLEMDTTGGDLSPYTDHDRLREILNQYVNNAIKFTDNGGVVLGYQTNGERLRIWVRDTGKGIPVDRCDERLFERFVKIDEFVPGTGLGLSICRAIAASIGGQVGVESTLGKGSLFWIEIPFTS